MFDFIPLQQYAFVYYITILIIVSIVFLNTQTNNITSFRNKRFITNTSILLVVFTVLYMGLRPISGRYFGDTATYNGYFMLYKKGVAILPGTDYLFHFFTKECARIMSAQMYFLICAALFILPMCFASKFWSKKLWGYSFLFLVTSFSFWAAGTNGMRSAIATSFVLMAFSRKGLISKILWFVLAVGFHKSMLLIVGAYIMTLYVKNIVWYFYGWLLCIPLSLIMPGFWENLFAGLISDDRVNYLTRGNAEGEGFAYTGFRWDFLIYSTIPVCFAYYFIYKKKFIDPVYSQLVGVYLTTNAFWILVIRANFSNRFAYLSWFMMGIIICYPLTVKRILKNQNQKIGYILIAYFAFTFLMDAIH
ncbi:EpsG family protein [Mucilaginibacter sp. UR6-11]|uniref:EpsG family protein n=1 Tax=Mucilaginibacter sp. UR6-11 TaxID=1435644 RepID=UPI001E30DFCE|nr:EpsG family protein [Mucilaginibacter sp. UR6-11]MCC8424860.1 EpsG family protein [Mucilaginibacter sp. UR6-11]